jgi:hypothetical protein
MLANDATSEFLFKKSLTLPQRFFVANFCQNEKKEEGNIL